MKDRKVKNRKDTAATPVAAATSSTSNDNQNRRGASTENVLQRSTQPGLKTSKTGFPISTANTTAPKSGAGPIADRPAAATSAPAAKLKPAPRLISPAHLKSAQKAAKAFENFSLSKFARDKVPENYIDPRNVYDPKAVRNSQKELISRQLQKLPDTDRRNSGVAITFPVAKLEEVRKALPGMSEHGGEVKLDDLLTYLRGRMNGTTFYSRGNPVMKRLTAAMQARSQARAIIERVKNGSREKRMGTARNGATQTTAGGQSSPNVRVPEKKEGSKP